MKEVKTRQAAGKQFWMDVAHLLTRKHKHAPSKARKGIDAYRKEVRRLKLGDVVYNQGEERVAEVVAGLINDGIAMPLRS